MCPPARHTSSARRQLKTLALDQQVSSKPADEAEQAEEGEWVPVCKPEELPKGVRKEVEVDGRQVLLFWYRNGIYCIEARSPAEGAYSEGFLRAKFTQDFAIECPSTGSVFSLKDGSIVSWYPNNPVLRALTPAELCRPLQIFPVKLAQEAIYVDVTSGAGAQIKDRGGAGTSLENNNVFTTQPTVYFEGQDPTRDAASVYQDGPQGPTNFAVLGGGLFAAGIVGVAGTASALYFENFVALAVFWLVLGGIVAFTGFNYINSSVKE